MLNKKHLFNNVLFQLALSQPTQPAQKTTTSIQILLNVNEIFIQDLDRLDV